MKRFKQFLVTSTAVLGLMAATAVSAADTKIGTVDMRAILSASPQAKAVAEKLKNEFKGREDKIVAVEKGLKEKAEKLQRNSAVMSEAEKGKLEKDIVIAQRELQRLQNEFREDANMRQQEETKKLLDRINVVIQDVAKKDNYDLIIHIDAAPFASKSVDITDKVMKAISANG